MINQARVKVEVDVGEGGVCGVVNDFFCRVRGFEEKLECLCTVVHWKKEYPSDRIVIL